MSKKNKMYIRQGNIAVMSFASTGYVFEVTGATQKLAQPSVYSVFAENAPMAPMQIQGIKIVPNGRDNLFPINLRDTLKENNLPGGIFRRQRGLMWGNGPALYSEQITDEGFSRKWTEDKEITNWLESWNYREYLRRAMVDFFNVEGIFTKIVRNKGPRIGQPGRFVALEHIDYQDARFEWPDDFRNPKNIITGDWELVRQVPFRRYPCFLREDPFFAPVSIRYDSQYSFAERFYGTPAYLGSISWIERGSDIPKILAALTKNSLNIKWHIKSPASYWETKREILQGECNNQPGISYSEKMLEDLKDKTYQKFAEVLSDVENVGKFFTSETIMNEYGKLEGWEIEAIDQKVKDFIESQILIAKQSDSAITSGMGLHPALSNILIDGKLASGSELLYAMKLHLATETAIPEEIITSAINDVIKIMWPDRGLKLGFYHEVVKTEDSLTAADRTKNKV